MTLHMSKQTIPFGSFTTIDIEAERLADFKLSVSYARPTRLTFRCYQAQHTDPLGVRNFIKFWDDAGTDPDGNPFTVDNPTFEGFIEDVDPGQDANEIQYTAYDPTSKANNEITVMSAPWQQGDVSESEPPEEAVGAYPRLVLNVTIDNDDDYAYSRAQAQTVGEILAVILGDQYHPLYWANAAPGDGSDAGNGTAYSAADLASLTFQPQEKIVIDSEPIRAAVMRVLQQWYPSWRLMWFPGDREWRFGDIKQSPTVTLTLNDFTGDNPVLSLNLDRSLEGRYTAVKIYGPETLTTRTVYASNGGLTNLSNGPILETYDGSNLVRGQHKWQITDEDFRRVARLLPTPIFAQTTEYQWAPNAFVQGGVWTRSPQFQARWTSNNAGTDAWVTIAGWWLDALNGIIDFGSTYVYRYNNEPAVSRPHYENPVDVRFIYPSYSEPLAVRYPSSGYSGTAYDDANLTSEMKLYDEMLAVGFLYGTPVTTATRVAQFQALAQTIHSDRKDIVYTGGVTLDGLAYRYLRLDARINIAGVDSDGDAIVTGWESIGALLTDAEFDFEEQITTLTFSSDQLELTGRQPEQIKELLRVRALEVRQFVSHFQQFSYSRQRLAFGGEFIQQTYTVGATQTIVAVDPFTGAGEAVL